MVDVEDLQRPQEEKKIEENCCGFNKHQDLILKSERTTYEQIRVKYSKI